MTSRQSQMLSNVLACVAIVSILAAVILCPGC